MIIMRSVITEKGDCFFSEDEGDVSGAQAVGNSQEISAKTLFN
jgi:hypothetical protein